jgi:hypothetical protein
MVCKKEACGCSCWTGCVSTCNAWNLQRMLPAALEKKELNPTWYGLKRISHSQPLRIVGFPQNHKCLSKSTYSTPISTRQILEIHKYRVGARCQLDCGEKVLPLRYTLDHGTTYAMDGAEGAQAPHRPGCPLKWEGRMRGKGGENEGKEQ